MRLDRTTIAVRACWSITAVALTVGCFVVVEPSEAKIAELSTQSQTLDAQLVVDEAAAKNIVRLESTRRDIMQELEGVNLRMDRVGLVAEFLRDVERLASGRDVSLVSVQNELSATNAKARSDPFDHVVMDLTLQGRYDAVLRTIADLSRARVLARVEQTSIDRVRGSIESKAPMLSMAVKVTVFYLRALERL